VRRFILASHGNYLKGMYEALQIIAGPCERLTTVSAYIDGKQTGDILEEIRHVFREHPDDEYLIMTDLLGGSVNTECMTLIGEKNVYLVAGINLMFLLTVILATEDEDIHVLIDRAIKDSRESILFGNDIESQALDEF